MVEEIERRAQKMLDGLWNSKTVQLRLAVRRAFGGVKPTAAEFLVNAAMLIHTKKRAEGIMPPALFTKPYRFSF